MVKILIAIAVFLAGWLIVALVVGIGTWISDSMSGEPDTPPSRNDNAPG